MLYNHSAFFHEPLHFPSVLTGDRVVTDEQLLASYVGGDQAAFAELVRRYQHELFVFLQRFVADAVMAEDLFQETFVQVHRNARSFDMQRRFRPWVFTIAANKARDYLRSSSSRAAQSLDNTIGGSEETTTFLDLMESDVATPPDDLANAEDVALVQQVLAEMPAPYREVLLLSYFHRFAYKQMAQMLDVPLGTVKSRLHAAVASFAKSFRAKQGTKVDR
jgi:RNA polymerase sigma-70 factor (ECF subfamily)